MDLIIKLRQKRITDEEFMAYVDESLKKIDADTEVIDQARLMFYQYVFRYFRLTPLMEDPEISDIHCIAYNKIRIKKRGKRQEADVQFASNQEYREFIDRVATQNGVNISNLNAIQRFADDETDKNFILRFTLITPIVTTYGNPYLIIRKFPKNFPEISDLVQEKFMSQQLADTLVDRFRTGSTLICGGNSDGKSTLLNALKETLPEDMAVMVAQQADELTTKHHPDMIFLHSLSESAESAVNHGRGFFHHRGSKGDRSYVPDQCSIHRADQCCHSPFPICTGSTGENRGLCITGIREQIQSRRTVKDDC